MNVRFEGNNGHDADVTQCLLMTQSGQNVSVAASAGCRASIAMRGDFALPDANAVNDTHSSCAPNRVTPGGGTDADTINAVHACPACFTDGGDRALRLLNGRKRQRLCR